MAIFRINTFHPETQEEKIVVYDSSLSHLYWEDGTPIFTTKSQEVKSPSKVEVGKKNLKTVKIQLGLSCNFECDYCSQRFVPHADSTNPNDVKPFVDNMSTWFEGGDDGLGKGTIIEFWGGEPFVYWKTFKPLAEELYKKYPNTQFSVITNGSMFDESKNEWLKQYNFRVSVSHDGPGQPVRGPDPLEDPQSKQYILDLWKELAPKGMMSFNSMINSKNISRDSIQLFFEKLILDNLGEEYLKYLTIGEGTFVDAYDDGGMANSLLDEEEDVKYRNLSYNEIRDYKADRFFTISQKLTSFIDSLKLGTRIETVSQKCGMEKSNQIAVDLNGNVLTCQNVSAVSNNPSGISHLIGHVSDLENIQVKTATHWSDREECSKCPVIHLCKGACLFLTGELWEASCNNAFSDNITLFCLAIEGVTGGYIPSYIDGPLREDRKDVFWWVNGKPEKLRKPKKVIPIFAA